jgi:hypothetical protein
MHYQDSASSMFHFFSEQLGTLTLIALASGRTQIGCEDNVNVCPILASSNVVPITSAIAFAAAGGTELPIASLHALSELPSSSNV